MKSQVEEKIFAKHSLMKAQVKNSLQKGQPIIRKTRHGKYLAITKWQEYITIIFTYKNGTADIKTAYRSSEWQKKIYRRKEK